MHLFDIDIPGRMTFQESKTLSPGNSLTIINTGMEISLNFLISWNTAKLELEFAMTSVSVN
jgi:hypothetical protein